MSSNENSVDAITFTRTISSQLADLPTSQDRHHAALVLSCYREFWNQLKFRKGWEQPHFSKDEVDHLLVQAAALTTLVRKKLDLHCSDYKLRMTGGCSTDFLFKVDYNPLENPERFVRELVHATLKDGKGYVEGLNAEQLDSWIDELKETISSNGFLLGTLPEASATLEETTATLSRIKRIASKLIDGIDKISAAPNVSSKLSRLEARMSGLLEAIDYLVDESNNSSNNNNNNSENNAMEDVKPQENSSASTAPPVVSDVEMVPTAADDSVAADVAKTETETAKNDETNAEEKKEEEKPQEEASAAAPSSSAPEESTTTTTAAGAAAADKMEGVVEAAKEGEQEQKPETAKEEGGVADGAADSSDQAQQTSTPEPTLPVADEEKNLLQIHRVSEKVGHMESSVADLTASVKNLNPELLTSRPAEALSIVNNLHKSCIHYNESLMVNLLALDSLACSGESRPLRKEQVKKIQALIDDVDSIEKKLKDLQSVIQEELKKHPELNPPKPAPKPASEPSAAESQPSKPAVKDVPITSHEPTAAAATGGAETKQQQQQQHHKDVVHPHNKGKEHQQHLQQHQQQVASKHNEEQQPSSGRPMSSRQDLPTLASLLQRGGIAPDDELLKSLGLHEPMRPRQNQPDINKWRTLRLEPQFEVEELPKGYVIMAMIPGMRKQDVEVSLANDVLTLSGCRLPSEEQIEAMKEALVQRAQVRAWPLTIDREKIAPITDEQLMLHAAGQFGSFIKKFAIPEDADSSQATARYDEETGVLQLVLPKRPRTASFIPVKRHSAPFMGNPMAGNERWMRPRGRTFFDDADMFW